MLAEVEWKSREAVKAAVGLPRRAVTGTIAREINLDERANRVEKAMGAENKQRIM